MVDEKPKRTRKRNAGVEIKDSTVGTGGGDIVGQDKVLGAKVYIDKVIVGVPPSPYELAKGGRVEQGSERIFISYSRKDGAEAAANLRECCSVKTSRFGRTSLRSKAAVIGGVRSKMR
jgi:hypothetical protein